MYFETGVDVPKQTACIYRTEAARGHEYWAGAGETGAAYSPPELLHHSRVSAREGNEMKGTKRSKEKATHCCCMKSVLFSA
jgi:hypothetical protein